MVTSQPRSSPLWEVPPEVLLMVCDLLSLEALGRLCRTSKGGLAFAEPRLYRRDALQSTNFALTWAIGLSACLFQQEVAWARAIYSKIFRYARRGRYKISDDLKHSSESSTEFVDAIATPLLLAAALGSRPMVSALLDGGFSPRTMGYNINRFISRRLRSRLDSTVVGTVGNFKWLLRLDEANGTRRISPLAYAFKRKDIGIVKKLLATDHDFGLCEDRDSRGLPAIWRHPTTLHHIAATKDLGALMAEECERQSVSVNHVVRFDLAPLHVAVEHCNMEAFNALMERPNVDIDVQTRVGRTSLMKAIRGCHTSIDAESRTNCQEMCISLINRGADVNHLVGGVIDETPLILAMKVAYFDWDTASEGAWPIVLELLNNGARLNDITPEGTVPIHVLFQCFISAGKPTAKHLAERLQELIDEHGADPNIPLERRSTMLGECLLWCFGGEGSDEKHKRIKKFAQYLLGRGARLCESELQAVFRGWLTNDPLRKSKWFDMADYGRMITPSSAFDAYETVLLGTPNLSLAKNLSTWLPWPSQANGLIPELLFGENSHKGIRTFILKSAAETDEMEQSDNENGDQNIGILFDTTGLRLLHHLVKALKANESYTEAQAIKDSEILIRRGATTCDNPGKSPSAVQWLKTLNKQRNGRYAKLLNLFYDTRDEEEGRLSGNHIDNLPNFNADTHMCTCVP